MKKHVWIIALAFAVRAFASLGNDDPGYTIDGGGSPGVEHYPSVCQVAPIGCGLHYNPGPGTWVRSDPEPYH